MRAMAAPAPPTSDLAHELRETIGRLVRRLRAEPGPPIPLMVVVGHLDREGPASVSELAAAQRMRPQSMAQTVKELEAAGMVSRRPDPDDGRRAIIDLTPAGRKAIADSRAAREDWLGATLERELEPAERDALRRALELLDRIAAA
jgi:DNA-binding MarR family transcriptional regulator